MIDATLVANELAQARACRLAAEAAWLDVEELLWELQRSAAIWRRLALAESVREPRLGAAPPASTPIALAA
jgi:hypothetical protein